jgi:hypothetical protein
METRVEKIGTKRIRLGCKTIDTGELSEARLGHKEEAEQFASLFFTARAISVQWRRAEGQFRRS